MSKVIIIGGGVAGLTAGIYGQKYGLDCEIFEKQPHAGGNLTGWHRNGCTIDNCIHWLTGTLPGNDMYEIWRETGMLDDNTPLHRGAHFFESRLGDARLALSADPDQTRLDMLALSPEDAAETERLIRTVKALIPVLGSGKPLEKAVILQRVPDVLRYWKTDLFHLANRFHHPLIRLALTDYIGGEFSSMALLCAYALFAGGNGSVPAGGSLAAAQRMQNRFEERGGVFHGNTPIRQIITNGTHACGVVTESGEFVPADHIICACDPAVVFGSLLPAKSIPDAMKRRLNDRNAPVFSSIHAAFLCDRSALRPFGTCIIASPSFSVRSSGRLPVREFSHEPGYAPDGKVLLQTLVFQTDVECRRWIALRNDSAAYERAKREFANEMANAIVLAMPELRESLELVDIWTPATYHRYFGARSGSYLSGALTPSASLNRLPPTIPSVKNLILATQWLQSPGGLPTAAKAGFRAANMCRA